MKTKFLIMRPDQPHETQEVELPRDPGFEVLETLLKPIIGGDIEHVSVLANFKGKARRADMFVDDCGQLKGLPVNGAATVIYRRATMLRMPSTDPESLPDIAGTAVLFDRIVWF